MSLSLQQSVVPLQIGLFGPLLVNIHGQSMQRPRTSAGYRLLVLLVLHHRRPLVRQELAALLWPDSETLPALANLRRSLTDLRDKLGPEAGRLHTPSSGTLALNVAGAKVDLLEFDALIAQGDAQALERALALYRGPLLPEYTDEWAVAARQVRQVQVLDARERLGGIACEAQDYARAIEQLGAVLKVDPWREAALRRLMEAQAGCGEHALALQSYRNFQARLRRKEGGAPEPQTSALFRKIQIAAQPRKQTDRAAQITAPPLENVPRSLPEPMANLRGRSEAIWEVVGIMDGARLVTLTGAGGLGKTQLAIHVAYAALPGFIDGAWFIDIASLDDPGRILPLVAATLGIREEAKRPLQETLLDQLSSKHLLLVLDNCEHLIAACASLARLLLDRCGNLRILATSRQTLGLACELIWQTPALPVPPETQSMRLQQDSLAEQVLAEIASCAAIQLFVDRAVLARPRFALNATNAPIIVAICRRLDGIPFALELAAAWIKLLTPEQILSRLDDCFRLLTRGDPAALPRQQTLQAALDWSYDLLSPAERRLLSALLVFAGGWTLEAAEEVCRTVAEDGDVLHLLAQLVDKSLVVYEEREGAGRYRLLETVRQYAQQKSGVYPIITDLQERHLDHFLSIATTADPHLTGQDQAQWMKQLDAERENFHVALTYGCRLQKRDRALQLAGNLGRFWQVRGYFEQGQQWLEQLLRPGEDRQNAVYLKALASAGALAFRRADHLRAQDFFTRSLAQAEALGDRVAAAASLGNLANIASEQGDLETAQSLFERCLTVFRDLADLHRVGFTLGNLAVVACRRGDFALGRARHEESIAPLEQAGDHLALAIAFNNLADVNLAMAQNRDAARWLGKSLALSMRLESTRTLANSLSFCCRLALQYQLMERAAVLSGAAKALRERIGVTRSAEAVAEEERQRGEMEGELGKERFERALAEGKVQSQQEAFAYATETITSLSGLDPEPPEG